MTRLDDAASRQLPIRRRAVSASASGRAAAVRLGRRLPSLSTPRIASISESETGASRGAVLRPRRRPATSAGWTRPSRRGPRAHGILSAERARARCSASSRACRASRDFLAGRRADWPGASADLSSQLDQPVHDRATDVGVGGRPRDRRARARRVGRCRSRLPGLTAHGLALAGIHRTGVEQPIGAHRRLQPLAGDQRPDGPRGRQRVGEPQLAADLGRGHVQHLAHLRPRGDGGQERVHPLQALRRSSRQSCPTAGRTSASAPRTHPVRRAVWRSAHGSIEQARTDPSDPLRSRRPRAGPVARPGRARSPR